MYLQFYGLKEEPFRLTPDPRFLHLAEPHREVLLALLKGVVNRKGFIVVTGPVGTGKTTLLHTALHVLINKCFENRKMVSTFLVNPTLNRDEFLEALLDDFEIRANGTTKPRRLQALHELFLDAQRGGGTAVVIIDEAHLLPLEVLEEIRLLSNTDTYREKLVQIILSGQPELHGMLAQPEMAALNQRVAVRAKLRPISLVETRIYIAERLKAAGLRNASPFSSAATEEIFALSGGVPRLINLLSDTCLSIGFETQTKQIGTDIVHHAAEQLEIAMPKDGQNPQALRIATANGQAVKNPYEALRDALREGGAAPAKLI
jgi:general secretion pathway protein A